jgi:hypothetical protein
MYFLPEEDGSNDISKIYKYTIFGSIAPLLYLMFFMILIWPISITAVTSLINCLYAILMSFLQFTQLQYSTHLNHLDIFINLSGSQGNIRTINC